MTARKPQKGSHTIFIACEGTVSEKEYFEAIGSEIIERDVWLTVYPEDNESPNDSMSLVKIARRNAEAYTEVWAVFDKNGHNPVPALTEAARVENDKIVNVAYSNIAFEHWVLLHFEKNSFAFQKSDCKDRGKKNDEYIECGKPGNTHANDCKGTICVAGHMRLCKYIDNYSKTGGFDLYGILVARESAAIENAAWLRFEKGAVIDVNSSYTINPYTNLDTLLRTLRGIQEIIIWGKTGSVLVNSHVNILVSDNLNVSIQNTADNGFLFNVLTRTNQFFLSNESGEIFKPVYKGYKIENNSGDVKEENNAVVIYKNDKLVIDFELPMIEYPLYFNFVYNGTRNIFMLKRIDSVVATDQQRE